MPMAHLRLFTAIYPPSPALDVIVRVQEGLRAELGHEIVRWISRPNLHLTLQFMGETPAELLGMVKECMGIPGEPAKAVPLVLGGVGAFPNAVRARTLWVGVEDTSGQLAAVQARVREALRQSGVPLDNRPFRPHLTIGYVRRRATRTDQKRVAEVLRNLSPKHFAFAVREMSLVESALTPNGSQYTVLYSVPLFSESAKISSGESARE